MTFEPWKLDVLDQIANASERLLTEAGMPAQSIFIGRELFELWADTVEAADLLTQNQPLPPEPPLPDDIGNLPEGGLHWCGHFAGLPMWTNRYDAGVLRMVVLA